MTKKNILNNRALKGESILTREAIKEESRLTREVLFEAIREEGRLAREMISKTNEEMLKVLKYIADLIISEGEKTRHASKV